MESSEASTGKPDSNNIEEAQGGNVTTEEERIALLQKINIAHEIGLDQSFTLKKEEPPENSLEKVVSDVVHSAFWDLFKSQISEDPPNLSMALSLLNEVKEGLYDIMLPHQNKMKSEVNEILDLELFRQQAEHGALDVLYYAKYILSIMGRLCAPLRDEKIAELSKETDIVSLFRGILDTLKLMKLDLVNFTIFSIRPELVSNHMEYERKNFSEFIKLSRDELVITEAWLRKHVKPEWNLKEVLCDAYPDLLTWDANEPFPETLMFDKNRLVKLKKEYYLLLITASTVLLSFNSIPAPLLSDTSLKEEIKQHVVLLFEDISNDLQLFKVIPNVIEQIKKDINEKLSSREMNKLSEDQISSMKNQIEEVINPENRVRSLVNLRILDFLKLVLKHPGGKTNFPPALVLFKNELQALSNSFMSIVTYNLDICFEHYKKIYNKNIASSSNT